MTPTDPILAFNGINAATGEYGLALNADQLTQLVFEGASPDELRNQREKFRDAARSGKQEATRGTKEGVDGSDLGQAGWGIIFAHADPEIDAIQDALQPLLTLRQRDAGPYFRVFKGPEAYRPNESKINFLRRFKVGSGAVDPSKGVPYYLLLIGSPELISYEFQYQLDVQFAVGRLDFETINEYAYYAQSVVAAETQQTQLERTATFFSVTNPDDSATKNINQYLVQPLLDKVTAENPEWSVNSVLGEDAKRTQLESIIGGEEKPALLFTASHGIEFPKGNPKQERHQGALLCSDWLGPKNNPKGQPLAEDCYLAGDHISSSANPSGMVAFHFACYGGGTPAYYDFARRESRERYPIADHPFVAQLPKRLLGHPNGGALAVVSHVDRAWSYSFKLGDTPQTTTFESSLARLLAGKPLGWAMEYFNERYAELASDLNTEIDRMSWGAQLEPYEVAALWTENNDARNYVILGDPAVRLAVAPADAPMGRISAARISSSVKRLDDGRPASIPQGDWQQTPILVQNALSNALDQIDALTAQLNEAQQAANPPTTRTLRDGGRSLRRTSEEGRERRRPPTRDGGTGRSSTTRGGGTRGGTTRGGTTRGGTTRGGTTRGGSTRGGK